MLDIIDSLEDEFELNSGSVAKSVLSAGKGRLFEIDLNATYRENDKLEFFVVGMKATLKALKSSDDFISKVEKDFYKSFNREYCNSYLEDCEIDDDESIADQKMQILKMLDELSNKLSISNNISKAIIDKQSELLQELSHIEKRGVKNVKRRAKESI